MADRDPSGWIRFTAATKVARENQSASSRQVRMPTMSGWSFPSAVPSEAMAAMVRASGEHHLGAQRGSDSNGAVPRLILCSVWSRTAVFKHSVRSLSDRHCPPRLSMLMARAG
jgi:hypothetical protein